MRITNLLRNRQNAIFNISETKMSKTFDDL